MQWKKWFTFYLPPFPSYHLAIGTPVCFAFVSGQKGGHKHETHNFISLGFSFWTEGGGLLDPLRSATCFSEEAPPPESLFFFFFLSEGTESVISGQADTAWQKENRETWAGQMRFVFECQNWGKCQARCEGSTEKYCVENLEPFLVCRKSSKSWKQIILGSKAGS